MLLLLCCSAGELAPERRDEATEFWRLTLWRSVLAWLGAGPPLVALPAIPRVVQPEVPLVLVTAVVMLRELAVEEER